MRGSAPPAGTPRAAAPSGEASLDRLAAAAVLVALVPVPLLGIGHPLTHLLVVGVVVAFGWLRVRPGFAVRRVAAVLDLERPAPTAGWAWVAAAGVATGLARILLDRPLLHGRAGIAFYATLLRDQGVIGLDGAARWELLAPLLPVLLVVIVLDGVFYAGLIQGRVAARSNAHVGVAAQALLFALPHTFAGPEPDPWYGVSTFLGGVAYGYVYLAFRNHWVAASLLWLHVTAVWVVMLATGPGGGG